MRRFLILLICTMTGSSVVGCTSQQGSTVNSTAAKKQYAVKVQLPAKEKDVPPPTDAMDKEAFVFRAKYYRTKGPCIQIGNKSLIPVVDGFAIIEVVKGNLKAKRIEVRPHSEGRAGYPKELVEEKVYNLRFTPSERTKQQLRENERVGYNDVWVDGAEIQECKVGK